jgi:transcriptional regulator with XRE-family HTH domain
VKNKNYRNRLGHSVKSARLRKGLTQLELAEELRITPRYLKAIENSGQKPSYDLFMRIVWVLELPANLIFYSEIDDFLNVFL